MTVPSNVVQSVKKYNFVREHGCSKKLNQSLNFMLQNLLSIWDQNEIVKVCH